MQILIMNLTTACRILFFYCCLYPEETAASAARIYCTGSFATGTALFILQACLETGGFFRFRRYD